MSDVTLGVDLSDAVTRLVAVDASGAVKARADVPAGKPLRDAIKRIAEQSGSRIGAAGVAVTTPSDSVDIASAIAAAGKNIDTLTIPAGTALALAEQWRGAAQGMKHVIALSVAEHVIAGVVLNGEAWTGAHGWAGSAGWFSLNPVEREDYRRLGGLEAELGAAGIVRRLVWRIKSGDESSVPQRARGDLAKITIADIFEGARRGDGVALSVVRDTAKYIAMAVSNFAAMLDPEIIVLGGIIATADDLLLDPVRVECSRRLKAQQADRLKIVLSQLGHDASAIGAARAAARVGA